MLERYHDSLLAGHQGTKRTLAKLQQTYYWPGMSTDVTKFVRSCDICQRFAEPSSRPVGLLHPLPIPQDRFREISIDFASINKVGKYDQLMVIVDRLTKLVRLIPGSKTDTSAIIANRFIKGGIVEDLVFRILLLQIVIRGSRPPCGLRCVHN